MAVMASGNLMQILHRGLTRSKLLFAIHHIATVAWRKLSRPCRVDVGLKVSLHSGVAIRPIATRC
jgi:hypothetical protein